MRLVETIVEASRHAPVGGAVPGINRAEFAASLPVIVLSCIDPRLNALLPARLGLGAEDFIWLRNAGNVITSPLSSTTRSLALACAIKGGQEIALIGHSDCRVARTTMLELIERFRALGLERARLPENLVEFFGLAASERQLVLRGVELVRSSPLIGPKVPVHGLLLDLSSGQLEWVVNGYDHLAAVVSGAGATGLPHMATEDHTLDPIGGFPPGALVRDASGGQIGEPRVAATPPTTDFVPPADPVRPKGTTSPSRTAPRIPPVMPVATKLRSWLEQVQILDPDREQGPKLPAAVRAAGGTQPPVLPGRQPPGRRPREH